MNWTSRARGRVGYAFDNWLFFIAGGLAVADVRGALAWKFNPFGMRP